MNLKNGKELLIREAEPEDAEKILEYLNIVGGESDNLLFGKDEFTNTLEQEREFLKSQKAEEKSLMLTGWIAGELASVCSLSALTFRVRCAHRGSIAVSCRKKFWNTGVATAMMQELLRFAKEDAGLEVLELEVREDNEHAIALYKKLGFKKIGYYEKFVKIHGEYYNNLLMNLYF